MSIYRYESFRKNISTAGVKVSPNTLERRSGAWKFKPWAFLWQNYWISQQEPTFLGPAS